MSDNLFLHVYTLLMIFVLAQIVFRSDPGKFVKLKYECDEFLKVVTTANSLIKDADSMDKQEITSQVHNWQV